MIWYVNCKSAHNTTGSLRCKPEYDKIFHSSRSPKAVQSIGLEGWKLQCIFESVGPAGTTILYCKWCVLCRFLMLFTEVNGCTSTINFIVIALQLVHIVYYYNTSRIAIALCLICFTLNEQPSVLFMNSTSALELCSTGMSVKPSFMLTRTQTYPILSNMMDPIVNFSFLYPMLKLVMKVPFINYNFFNFSQYLKYYLNSEPCTSHKLKFFSTLMVFFGSLTLLVLKLIRSHKSIYGYHM